MQILDAILNNSLYVGIVLALIFIFHLGNMAFGLALNVVILKQDFDKNKIKTWLFRTILILIGTFLLCAGISILPFAISFIGIEIPEEYSIIINFSLIVLVSFGTLKKECEKCFENYRKCMEILWCGESHYISGSLLIKLNVIKI